MVRCKRLEFKDCPYRKEDIDFEHWYRAGKSPEFARERATILCESIPCFYAIELACEKHDKSYQEILKRFREVDSNCQVRVS